MNDQHIADNIKSVQNRIAQAAERVGRRSDEVTLVAVTKTYTSDFVLAAQHAGISDMGENRVQEALEKMEVLDSGPTPQQKLRWHLIGHLQSNKARLATGKFALMHSLDSSKLADAIQKAALEMQIYQPVLIQMNLSREDTKSGLCTLDDACRLVEHIETMCPNVKIQGLMTIAAPCVNPEDVRKTFVELRELKAMLAARFPTIDWSHLSMGMTGDLEVAVEEGATLVRVGSAIFGGRTPK